MDSATYCKQAISALRDHRAGALGLGDLQAVVVLSSFSQQELAPRNFTRALNLLVDRSERTGQPRLAEAARRILDDWRSKAAAG